MTPPLTHRNHIELHFDVADDAQAAELGAAWGEIVSGKRTKTRPTPKIGRGDRTHQKGYISDPVGKAKSVLLTDEGLRESELWFETLFCRSGD
jgi:hypothetical protein